MTDQIQFEFQQAKVGWLARVPGLRLSGWGRTREDAEASANRIVAAHHRGLKRYVESSQRAKAENGSGAMD